MTVGASRMRVMLDAERGRAASETPADAAPVSPDAATPTFTAAAVVEQASGG